MNRIVERLKRRVRDPERARTTGTFGEFRVFPPASGNLVEAAEKELKFELPLLLRRIYQEVGNGGFGPGYGLIGLSGGAPFIDHVGNQYDLVSTYYLYRGEDELSELNHDFSNDGELQIADGWFDKLIVACQWGDDHYSLLDCSKRPAPVVHWIAYGGAFLRESESLETWIDDWLDDVDLWKRVAD